MKKMSKMLSNVTEGIHPPSSMDIFEKYCTMDIETETMSMNGGFKTGELSIMMATRGTGKSQIAHYASLFNSIFKPEPLTDIKLSQGKVYGFAYYTLEPVGGSWHEMEDWCSKSFGPPGGDIWEGSKNSHATKPNERWYMNNRKFWFRDVKDRDWFLMRWRS
jgi:hypothetical protein